MPSPVRRRALSLAETVIAAFLLLGAFAILVGLYHTSLRDSLQARIRMTATRVAQRRLAEVRAWARSYDNFYSGWAPYTGVSGPDPDNPEVSVAVSSRAVALSSPCTGLESVFPVASRRSLTNSTRWVRVAVRWGPTGSLELTSLIGAPTQTFGQMVVAGAPLTLAANATLTGTARLEDSQGHPIPDVMFEWFAEAAQLPGGNGVMDVASSRRTGQQVVYKNAYPSPLKGTWTTFPGPVHLRVLARYRGQQQQTFLENVTNL